MLFRLQGNHRSREGFCPTLRSEALALDRWLHWRDVCRASLIAGSYRVTSDAVLTPVDEVVGVSQYIAEALDHLLDSSFHDQNP
jgi:hypothetical protein